MKKIAGVRFKKPCKLYFFDQCNFDIKVGDYVIVETSMGKELGKVTVANREVDESKLDKPIKKIEKIATKEDLKHQTENAKKEKEAFELCNKKIKEHNLKMHLVEARYLLDNSKLIFYFTAEGRVDFRNLVKDLAAVYRTRIELRQIGVRDQVKRLGGNGICGRELCCCSFLNDFDSVSIKMAKEQNLSLNASKITGCCVRLMCCLKYEQNVYEDKMKKLPHPGAIVKTGEGEGTVESVEVLREIIKVKLNDEEGNSYYKKYNVADVQIIKDSKKEIKSDDNIDPEELKELEKIEQMDKYEKKNTSKDEE